MFNINLNKNHTHYRLYQEYRSRLDLFLTLHQFFLTSWNYLIKLTIFALALNSIHIFVTYGLHSKDDYDYVSYLLTVFFMICVGLHCLFLICMCATRHHIILYEELTLTIKKGIEREEKVIVTQSYVDKVIESKNKHLLKLVCIYRCYFFTTFCFMLCSAFLLCIYY